jgi:CheY-like chemotaxis protein
MTCVAGDSSNPTRPQVLTLETLRLMALAPQGDAGIVSKRTPKGGDIAVASRRVLVIEDHADTAEAIAVCLRAASHQVEVASDGEAGLAIARLFRPDVVFCDIWLPGVDGYYVTRALKKDPRLAGCYFVAISGVQFRPPSIGVGFNEYLLKPIDAEVLLTVMSRAIGH